MLPDRISKQKTKEILEILTKDREIHVDEFKYWSRIGENDEGNLWFITPYIREIYYS
jgi:hypothetical protein